MSKPTADKECEACGEPIFFVNGTPYEVRKTPALIILDAPHLHTEVRKEKAVHLNHFVQCSDPERFSKE